MRTGAMPRHSGIGMNKPKKRKVSPLVPAPEADEEAEGEEEPGPEPAPEPVPSPAPPASEEPS